MPVDTPRSEYANQLDKWQRCRDAFEGGDAVKAAGEKYLPKLGKAQPAEEYEAYKTRALYYNATGRTVQGLTGVAFQKAPDVQAPEAIEANLEDITLAGEPFVGFAMRLVREVLNPGRYGVLVDFHASTQASEARPYWVPYLAEQIINWEAAVVNGDTITSMVVLKECVEQRAADGFGIEKVEQYRVCDLLQVGETYQYRVRLFRRSGTESKEWIVFDTKMPTRTGAPLDFIPFVFFGPEGITPTIDKPPLLDLVDVNLSHYRSSADYEHGLHYTGLPTPVITGSKATAITLGSKTAIVLPEQGADAKYLEFTGKGLTVLKDALEGKQELMARLGGRLLEGRTTQREAAETVKMRHAGDSASLQMIVGAASLGLTKLLRWHAWWAGLDVADKDVAVKLNSDFFSTDLTADEVRAIMLAYQGGGMSIETVLWKLSQGGWLPSGIDAEAEKQRIAAGADDLPEDGNTKPGQGSVPPDAIKWLDKAIARHERHMNGTEATSVGSQQQMMDEMKAARDGLLGAAGDARMDM